MASGLGGFTGACVDGTRVNTGAGVVGFTGAGVTGAGVVGRSDIVGGNNDGAVEVGGDTVTGVFVGGRVVGRHLVRKHHNAPIVRKIVAKSFIVLHLVCAKPNHCLVDERFCKRNTQHTRLHVPCTPVLCTPESGVMSYSGESMVDENESISARAGQPHLSTDDGRSRLSFDQR